MRGLGPLDIPIHARQIGRMIFADPCSETLATYVRAQLARGDRGCNRSCSSDPADQVPARASRRVAMTRDDGSSDEDELRSGDGPAQEGLGGKSALEGHKA